jgi:PAS domain S-box-containing protein
MCYYAHAIRSRGVHRPEQADDAVRVLVVDDDSALLDLTRTYLETEFGFSVTTARSVDVAMSRLDSERFDCIVSDYRMPVVDGLEFLRRVREERSSSIPFVIFTGNSREEVAIEALNLGADRYFRKGGDPHTQYQLLADAIEQTVDHHRSARLAREYEERLELAQGIADFGIIDWDLTTNRVYCSAELCRMFGLPEDKPLTIEDIESVMHPDDEEMIQSALGAAIADETEYHLSHRILRPDGEVIWTKNQARLMRDEEGNPVRLLGIAVDVTAERTAEPVESN